MPWLIVRAYSKFYGNGLITYTKQIAKLALGLPRLIIYNQLCKMNSLGYSTIGPKRNYFTVAAALDYKCMRNNAAFKVY